VEWVCLWWRGQQGSHGQGGQSSSSSCAGGPVISMDFIMTLMVPSWRCWAMLGLYCGVNSRPVESWGCWLGRRSFMFDSALAHVGFGEIRR